MNLLPDMDANSKLQANVSVRFHFMRLALMWCNSFAPFYLSDFHHSTLWTPVYPEFRRLQWLVSPNPADHVDQAQAGHDSTPNPRTSSTQDFLMQLTVHIADPKSRFSFSFSCSYVQYGKVGHQLCIGSHRRR